MYTIAHLAIYMAMYGMVTGMSIGVSVNREKRDLYKLGKGALRGIQVMKKLKKDAKPVLPDQYKINLYSKEGDFSQAMKDFNSFQPKNVVDCNRSSQGSRKWALVGDRYLCLEEVGESGKPTLQIFRGLGTSREKLDTFTYNGD